MQILSIQDPHAIKLAQVALSRGEMVIYPTETCYGIAVDTTNRDAVTKLLLYKGDRHRQVAVAVDSRKMAEKYVTINSIADNLYSHFLPGPITVISKSKHQVDERLESAEGTLGIRIPAHDFATKLIKTYGVPITTTSANTSGKKEPYSLEDWQKYTTPGKQKMVSIFLDAGKLTNRPTSTVVDTTLNDPVILRQGEIVLPSSSPSIETHSPQETQDFGLGLLRKYLNLSHKYPILIALQGELGVGKTQISKGFAQALGIKETIASPTYTIMHEYPFKDPKYSGIFYHIDTWRLSDMTELDSTLHLKKILVPGNIVVMEWAGKAKSYVESHKKDCAIVIINIKEKDVNTRIISYSLFTPDWS